MHEPLHCWCRSSSFGAAFYARQRQRLGAAPRRATDAMGAVICDWVGGCNIHQIGSVAAPGERGRNQRRRGRGRCGQQGRDGHGLVHQSIQEGAVAFDPTGMPVFAHVLSVWSGGDREVRSHEGGCSHGLAVDAVQSFRWVRDRSPSVAAAWMVRWRKVVKIRACNL